MLIVASIIGANRVDILRSGGRLTLAVFCLHTFGFLLGYTFARLLRSGVVAARTISIEVGMQNSGLGVVLASRNFPDPLVAVPSAISSLFHSLIASAVAAWWRGRRRTGRQRRTRRRRCRRRRTDGKRVCALRRRISVENLTAPRLASAKRIGARRSARHCVSDLITRSIKLS
jgi:hypothetical protein